MFDYLTFQKCEFFLDHNSPKILKSLSIKNIKPFPKSNLTCAVLQSLDHCKFQSTLFWTRPTTNLQVQLEKEMQYYHAIW
jgi:hypothetical protein